MGTFEDFVGNIRTAADVVCKKTGKIVDISKLKITQTEIDNQIANCFQELGRMTYENYKSTGSVDQKIMDECISEIGDLFIRLRSVTEQITRLKNKKMCKNCGHKSPMDASYCGKCGKKFFDSASSEGCREIVLDEADIEEKTQMDSQNN